MVAGLFCLHGYFRLYDLQPQRMADADVAFCYNYFREGNGHYVNYSHLLIFF